MKRTILLSTSAICTAVAGAMLLSPATAQKLPPYDPYPDDILPPKVLSEIHRVQREFAAFSSNISCSCNNWGH